eukprot:SAG22_NODE_21643_length_255_cov_0.730769_1_plen_23_part_01
MSNQLVTKPGGFIWIQKNICEST